VLNSDPVIARIADQESAHLRNADYQDLKVFNGPRQDARPRLVAVVVSCNRLQQLRRCMGKLLDSPVDHVVVVDNDSTDGSREWLLRQAGRPIDLLFSARNLGGAGGFETGIRHAVRRHDPDWIVVLDDDARPAAGAIRRFLSRDYRGCDAVAAAVHYPDGRICEMNRPLLNPFWKWREMGRILFRRGGLHLADVAYDGGACQKVDVATFVGLFLSRKVIERCGYPDGRLFLYGDDALYTLRLGQRGLTILFDPEIRFIHDCSTFQGARRVFRPLWKAYYNYRNRLILSREMAGGLFWPILPVLVMKWVWNARYYREDGRQYYLMLWRAVRDGVSGRTGISHEFGMSAPPTVANASDRGDGTSTAANP